MSMEAHPVNSVRSLSRSYREHTRDCSSCLQRQQLVNSFIPDTPRHASVRQRRGSPGFVISRSPVQSWRVAPFLSSGYSTKARLQSRFRTDFLDADRVPNVAMAATRGSVAPFL